MTHQRLWDLVRAARHQLHEEGLISNEEYAHLVSGHGGSAAARRLENYDEVRAMAMDLITRIDQGSDHLTLAESAQKLKEAIQWTPKTRS